MAIESTREWIAMLEQAGELLRVGQPLSTDLEITEAADRQMKSPEGGRALLIENPVGASGKSEFPVLINAFGSRKRMAMSLGVETIEQIAGQLGGLMKAKPPQSFGEAIRLLGQALDLRHAKPKEVSGGPCQEVVWKAGSGPGLGRLPILKCWPEDGGPFVTFPIVVTRDPDTGEGNWGMYRMQVFDEWTTGMHWQLHKTGARHGRRYEELGKRMPVSVFIGGDPAYTFCATAPLPDGVDEALFAGFLRKDSVRLTKCVTNDLRVPADADFVIEGYVDPPERRPEGPFGDHTGFYTPCEDYPVFHVTAITHRRDAVYPATIVGKPPMEDFYMGEASVRIFLPVFKMNFPELRDMAFPPEGVFHNLVFVSIKKQYPYHAFKVMNGLWGMGQMMFQKIIVVVDADVDVHNTSEVLFKICANIDPQRDILFTRGPSDSLDHATTELNIGSHMGIDATEKMPGEGYKRGWPKEIRMPLEVREKIDALLRRKPR